jgi:hypothetical protein
MSFLPPNLAFVAKQMSNYSRNRFRLETNSTKNVVTAGDVITVNLPESALLDMKSFRWVFEASSVPSTTDASNLSFFPSNMQSLIERVEIYINGVQVQNGCAQYNTLCQVLKLGRSNNDRNDSIENCLSKSHITDIADSAAGSASAPTNVSCVIDKWYGFLNETSTRFLDTSLLGQIQVRITLATEKVMIPFRKAASKGYTLTSVTFGAGELNYILSKIYFTIDSLVVDPMYSMALRDQLAKNEFIPINYKEYYTYTLGSQKSDSYQNRFALSSGSIDKLYGITRPSEYNTGNVAAITVTGATGTDSHVAKYFAFESLSESSYSGNADDLKYQWSINNVAHPQYRAQLIEACADLAYINDKCGDYSDGIMPTNFETFKTAQTVIPLVLNHPETPISVMSGYNSRGINSMMVLDVQGLDTGSFSSSYESMVIVETTAQLRASQGKSLATSK